MTSGDIGRTNLLRKAESQKKKTLLIVIYNVATNSYTFANVFSDRLMYPSVKSGNLPTKFFMHPFR